MRVAVRGESSLARRGAWRASRARASSSRAKRRSTARFVEWATIVVNATPLAGPAGPREPGTLAEGLLVLDLVYGETPTAWVRAARAGGLEAHDGLGLLVFQARRSLSLWLGREVPLAPLLAAVSVSAMMPHAVSARAQRAVRGLGRFGAGMLELMLPQRCPGCGGAGGCASAPVCGVPRSHSARRVRAVRALPGARARTGRMRAPSGLRGVAGVALRRARGDRGAGVQIPGAHRARARAGPELARAIPPACVRSGAGGAAALRAPA